MHCGLCHNSIPHMMFISNVFFYVSDTVSIRLGWYDICFVLQMLSMSHQTAVMFFVFQELLMTFGCCGTCFVFKVLSI